MEPLRRHEALPTYFADPGFLGLVTGHAIPRQIGIDTIPRLYTWTSQTNEREPFVTLCSKVLEGFTIVLSKNFWVNIKIRLQNGKILGRDGC